MEGLIPNQRMKNRTLSVIVFVVLLIIFLLLGWLFLDALEFTMTESPTRNLELTLTSAHGTQPLQADVTLTPRIEG
jgi:cell division protein FtsX